MLKGMSNQIRKWTGPRRAGDRGQQGEVSSIESEGDVPRDRLTLSVTEAAGRLGISRGLAYELVARGELPALQLGKRIVIPVLALEDFVAAACPSSRRLVLHSAPRQVRPCRQFRRE